MEKQVIIKNLNEMIKSCKNNIADDDSKIWNDIWEENIEALYAAKDYVEKVDSEKLISALNTLQEETMQKVQYMDAYDDLMKALGNMLELFKKNVVSQVLTHSIPVQIIYL
jgi:argininosuccinate lyase